MALEVFKEFANDKYHSGLTLQEYAGSYWLINSRKLEDGRIMHDWVFPSRDKKPIAKSLPWKVKLGDTIEEALATMRFFASFLLKSEEAPAPTENTKDDIPF
jgi:hypothetical protein